MRAATTLSALGLIVAVSQAAVAQDAALDTAIKSYLDKNPQHLQRILRETLLQNPEMVQEALLELQRRRALAEAAVKTAAVRGHADQIFRSFHDGALGNAEGDVIVVEFFDYNCGYCKRALSDTVELIGSNPRVKVVLKEFPVLGPGSVEAARVAHAVRLLDPDGGSYQRFHKQLRAESGPINKARALAVAADVGLDPSKVETMMNDAAVNEAIDGVRNLAGTLGIRGTPSYVIGDSVVVGAVGLAALRDKIATLK